MSTFLGFICVIGIVVTIVGTVMLIIDYAKERKIKTSLIVLGTGITVGIVGFLGAGAVELHQERVAQAQEKQDEHAFKAASDKFTSKYAVIGSNCEDLGNTVYKAWGTAIDNSGDDYDPTDTVSNIMTDNIDDVYSIDSDVKSEKKLLDTMEKHKNDKYNYTAYKKAYTDLKSFSDTVTSPSGSYNDFASDYSDADKTVSNQYDNMANN
ncbi:hypothetical protein [Paucilactobacillus kaifaensis]|uniref:hypothetical protein n=1 Tax=Paucilactobacillus kaifaensis TaxID=2559921 RepID=UPI0010FA550B|nr:hypothetical protein [Paucilactobacillus kaifaensis]